VELVQIVTADGVRLDGVLRTADASNSSSRVDAWLGIHGTGSNFYASRLLAALEPRLARSAAVLRVNTRGHDLVATGGPGAQRWLGAAFERVADATHDLAAWLHFLEARGYRRIGLLGHSLGAVKAIHFAAQPNGPALAAVVAASPPRLSYAHYAAGERSEEFLSTLAKARSHVEAGHPDELMLVEFPLTYWVSAAAYVDRYGPEERYNVLGAIPRVRAPLLVTYGSRELDADVSFQGMPEEIEKLSAEQARQVAVLAGGDHLYSTVELALADRIEVWLLRLAR
jgi:pimeloyl-ACP methyl ester carboxylesterase